MILSTRKLILIVAALLLVQPLLFGQNDNDTVSENEVKRIINFLAADSLNGRGNGSEDLLKAALYIGDEYKKSGLQNLAGNTGYYLPFRPFGGSNRVRKDDLVWNGKRLAADEFLYLRASPGNYSAKKLADFTVIKIDSYFTADIYLKYRHMGKDLLLWSSLPQPDKENYFPPAFDMPDSVLQHDLLMVCANKAPTSLSISGVESYYSNIEYNVVGMLKGKTKPNEIVLFSAHYDHEGVYNRGRKRDGIMNGANDNASGTTALLMLAKYFALRNDNERTILFCAFAGEELGLLGSKNFAEEIDASSIVALINLEMLGVPQYGKNNVFITGSDRSSLPEILTQQLAATPVQVKPEPSEEERMLFRRSDNYSFVKKGVPAHTIMSSDDSDKCYHKPCDELKRIDTGHMTIIIKAIATATRTLINGEETPTRIADAE